MGRTGTGPKLKADFDSSQDAFKAAIPRLIVENNLFGIDIDRRASQIAALALFLKAKAQNREVQIEKSGIVCAEPMPGGRALLDELRAPA